MKKYVNMATLPWLVALSGAACAMLKLSLLGSYVDEKGLIVRGAIPGVLMVVLAAAIAVLAAVVVLRSENSSRYEENFSASIFRALTCCALAAALVTDLLSPGLAADRLATIRLWLGYASAASLLVIAYKQLKGEPPLFVFHAMVCLFCGVHLVDQYRVWCDEPALVMYIFQLMTWLSMLLSAYQRTAFEVGLGSRRALVLCGLPAIFCCLPAMVAEENALVYLVCGLWCLSGLLPPAPQEVADDEAA